MSRVFICKCGNSECGENLQQFWAQWMEGCVDGNGVCMRACELGHFSRVRLFAASWTVACQAACAWDSPSKNAGVGFHALLQGIFLTQGSNPHLLCLLHCSQTLSLGHQGSLVSIYLNNNIHLFQRCFHWHVIEGYCHTLTFLLRTSF